MSWFGDISQTAQYSACVHTLRLARFMLMYRRATQLSMELKFTPKDTAATQIPITLQQLLNLDDFTPDSFNSQQAQAIRATTAQKNSTSVAKPTVSSLFPGISI